MYPQPTSTPVSGVVGVVTHSWYTGKPAGVMAFAGIAGKEYHTWATGRPIEDRLLDPYVSLGVRPVINVATTLTMLGGSLMCEEVLAAMNAASSQYVSIEELHLAVGRRIATLTGNEAAHVTGGCAAAIVLGVLAAANRGSTALIDRPLLETDLPSEVVVDRSHDIAYLPAIRLAGAHICWIGDGESTTQAELHSAIADTTAAVFYVAGSIHEGAALSLAETIRVAHASGVPVIVDAAAQLPPVQNLRHYTTELGADLALFSGGKGLRGPQSSGLIVGSRRYVAACAANASPSPGLARALKVGKEEIVGLAKAIELYVARDQAADRRQHELVCGGWVRQLDEMPGVTACLRRTNEAGQPSPRVLVTVSAQEAGGDADQFRRELWDRPTRIAVLADSSDTFYITPDTLASGEAGMVIEAIRSVCDRMRKAKALP